MKGSVNSGFIKLFGPFLYASSALFYFVIVISMAETLLSTFAITEQLPEGFHIELMVDAISSDIVIAFLPILSTIPFAGSYIDDIKSKFVRILLVRSSYRTYISGRIIVAFLAGGLTILLAVLIAWGTASAIIIPFEEKNDEGTITSVGVLIEICFLMFLNGGFWSVAGMAMSTLMESKCISYAIPFVFYYILVILYERYFSGFFIIYPKIWVDPTAWPFGCWGATTFLLEITLLLVLLFSIRARRRLQQL